ncbi:MAG TPA: hypothetical protein VGK73_13050 [Polyangiaceae bacterium]
MRHAWPRLGALALALACAALSAPARADVTQKASAEALFDDALRLMKTGSYAAACPKLESSQKLDPGIGTLLYLGECYERVGRTASAWATFREAASAAEAAGQGKRVRMARDRSERLEKELAFLTIEVVEPTRALAGLLIHRDGVVCDPVVFGAAVPVDPGPVVVAATAPGYDAFSVTVEVDAAARQKVFVPLLAKSAPAEVPVAAAAPKVAAPEPRPAPVPPRAPPPAPRGDPGKGQRIIGLSLGGLGLVGAGIGTYFGLRAIDEDSQADEGSCDETTCQDAGDFEHADSASRAAEASNVAFAIGAGLLATGIVVYLTAPSAPDERALRIAPRVGPAFAGIGVEGRL